MNNDNNSDKLKLWVGIFLVLLMLSPFIIKAVRSEKPIKDDIVVGSARFRH
jgi:hypothetical protein